MKVFIPALVYAAAALTASAQTFRNVANFDYTNGAEPVYVTLAQGLDGNFYGTTSYGGTEDAGTVFRVTPGGMLTTLYNFCSQPPYCSDGSHPSAGLVLGTDGNFYGTTSGSQYSGYTGTVFKITPQGVLTTLAYLDGVGQAGLASQMIQGTDGNFYGTTSGGEYTAGTVFRVTADGSLKTLHSFGGGTDGSEPVGGLVQANDGNVYGTTYYGGVNDDGTVYKLTPNGTFTPLYTFCQLSGCADGSIPVAGLIQGTDGNLYGTTYEGGLNNLGTFFKITLQGAFSTLYSFAEPDGGYVQGPLIQPADGNFYGVSSQGGPANLGTIFEITPTGSFTTLYTLLKKGEGWFPVGGMVQATSGKFYGTTSAGGSYNDGTVFALSVGLGPFVESLPSFGAVGANIRIIGYNLAGTTSVTFNGTPATFTVVSGQYIKSSVPPGATTGDIEVTTPTGTLTSNKSFQVLP